MYRKKNAHTSLDAAHVPGLRTPAFAALYPASEILIPTRVFELSAEKLTPTAPALVSPTEIERQLAAIERLQSLTNAISAAEDKFVQLKTLVELRDAEERQALALALSAAEERTSIGMENAEERVALAAALGAAEDRGTRTFLSCN